MHKEALLENVDKIHTTEIGVTRIQRNLGISDEPVGYCISKLKKKKGYYVRVRTYKTVSSVNYYSAWSKAKYVTVK